MGNLNSSHEIRELFEKLDVNGDGSLSLKEILSSGLPELSETSLLCLFRFDEKHEGSINYNEFVNLIKHLKRLERERVNYTRHKRGIGYNLRRLLHKKEQKRPTKCWKALDFRSAEEIKSKLNRNSQTPQIVGTHNNNSTSNLMMLKEEYPSSDENSDYYYESSDDNEIDEEEEREGKLFLNKSLREVRGKERFMDWLFKLADYDKEDRVTLEELGLVLKLIARDHINTSSFVYNEDEEDTTPEFLPQSLMDEFNVGKTGYLKKSEFMVLAEIIADHYDELVSNSEERYIQDFRLKWKLGEGASGVVMLAIKETPSNPNLSRPSANSNPNIEKKSKIASKSSNSLNKLIPPSDHSVNPNVASHSSNQIAIPQLQDMSNINNTSNNTQTPTPLTPNHSPSSASATNSGNNNNNNNNNVNTENHQPAHNNNRYAIKIIKKTEITDYALIDKEIQAMLMIRHPNVVELYEVLEDSENVYFVMELCGGGSIADYVTIKPFSEDLSRTYFKQLLLALKHCHDLGIVHRDLKLENLLLDNEGVLHVSDFGQSGIYQAGWDLFSTTTGCILHISPEQLNGEFYSGEKADTWAIGVVLYRMLFGQPPFFCTNPQELIDKITNAEFDFPENIKVSQEVKDFICRFLQKVPSDRIDLAEALNHPWINIEKSYNPSLLRHYISKKYNGKMENIWADLKTFLKLFDIVPVQVNEECHDYIHKLKCHYPHKDLKFSIRLNKTSKVLSDDETDSSFPSDYKENDKSDEDWYYLELALWEGESLVFRQLSEKIIRKFEKTLRHHYNHHHHHHKKKRKKSSHSSLPQLESKSDQKLNTTTDK